MAKIQTAYVCNHCGSKHSKWQGQCSDCSTWNSLTEETTSKPNSTSRFNHYAGSEHAELMAVAEVDITDDQVRLSTGLSELDRVLGGGLVAGSVVLLGGDPGIGKSTLLLQTLVQLSAQHKALYITGEESLQQVAMRAKRLGLNANALKLLTATNVDVMISLAQEFRPQVMVVDSIQTIYSEQLSSAPGSVSQVRETAASLVRFAKQSQTALFVIGHVTKEGALAGPRVLEHMVDTVLYFEGQGDSRYRVVRAVKNRFGAVNELGVFAMTDAGLREVNNPSAIFLSRGQSERCGSVVMATWEGTRPLLVEVQALVDQSHIANPRRVCVGIEHNRLAMLLAVLHRHAGIATYDQDVFANIVGGMRIQETGIDLALLIAIVSSLRNKPLPKELIVFGEVGLTGEIRPVQCGQERLKEAQKLGFTQAIIPLQNETKKMLPGLTVHAVANLSQALSLWKNNELESQNCSRDDESFIKD
ncbi:MAG: DNA repair protein RadA [Legionellales bacterium]|nr:DNA repair protein RadA [Legionellales bacterium]